MIFCRAGPQVTVSDTADGLVIQVECSTLGLAAVLEWQDRKSNSFFQAKMRAVDVKNGTCCIMLASTPASLSVPDSFWVERSELRVINQDKAEVCSRVQPWINLCIVLTYLIDKLCG